MINLNKILVPIDFSEPSKHALQYGCEFAAKFDSELHMLHVQQDLVQMIPEPGLAFPLPGNYMQGLEEDAQRALQELPGSMCTTVGSVIRTTSEGSVFVEIMRYAKGNDIDLIVLGTHGHSGFAHLLLGSVAEKVVRNAPCPVLSVRHPEHEFVMS